MTTTKLTELQLEALIFKTSQHHLRYGKGTSEELKTPYAGTEEENEHQTTIWATVRREVENEWIYGFEYPKKYADAFWRSVESHLVYATKATTVYPEIHPELLEWINA